MYVRMQGNDVKGGEIVRVVLFEYDDAVRGNVDVLTIIKCIIAKMINSKWSRAKMEDTVVVVNNT